MPFNEGISSQYLIEALAMLKQNMGQFSGNADAKMACISYLETVKSQCPSRNSTFTKAECDSYCGKYVQSHWLVVFHMFYFDEADFGQWLRCLINLFWGATIGWKWYTK